MVVAMAMPTAPSDDEQKKREHDVRRHADAGIDHRRPRVLAGEEAGVEHLDQHEGGKPRGERGKHGSGRLGVDGGEGAALEQHAHDRVGRNEQRDGGGQRQEQRGFERAVLAVHGRGVIAGAKLRLSSGKSTTPTATPITPSGSWNSRSA